MGLTRVKGSQVSTTATGDVASTNSQAAIAELDTEKANATGTNASGSWNISASQLGGIAASSYARKDTAQTWGATQVPDNGTATISATGTYVFDGSDQIREITVTGNSVITFGAPTGITRYASYKLILTAGDTNTRTYAWNAAFKFPAGSSPLTYGTTTTNGMDIINFLGGASNTLIYQGHISDVR